MSARSLFARRDPDWQTDGPAARREHRLRRIRGGIALMTSLVAVAGAAWIWALQLGLLAALGIHSRLPFG